MLFPNAIQSLREVFLKEASSESDLEKEAALEPRVYQPFVQSQKSFIDTSAMTPEEAQLHLWTVYKHGIGPKGNGDLDPFDQRVRGQLIGHFQKEINGAVKKKRDSVYPGEAKKYLRDVAYRAFDRFDPSAGVPLGKFVEKQIFPEQLNGQSVLNRLARTQKNFKATSKNNYAKFAPYRRARAAFMAEHERLPSDQELADRSGIPIATIIKMRHDGADEYDTARVIDDETLTPDRSLPQKDAVMTVYASSDALDRKIMMYRFPEILGGKPVPFLHRNRGSGKWIAEQLGIPEYDRSRRETRFSNRIRSLIS